METTLVIVLGLMLLGAIAAATLLGLSFIKARSELEHAWSRLYSLQQAEIVSLRNRLAVHRWEDFHNLQLTPTELDVAQRTGSLPDLNGHSSRSKVNTADDFEERLAEALRANGSDLEGDAWSPTVG